MPKVDGNYLALLKQRERGPYIPPPKPRLPLLYFVFDPVHIGFFPGVLAGWIACHYGGSLLGVLIGALLCFIPTTLWKWRKQ